MTDNQVDKTSKKSISFPNELLNQGLTRADELSGGNFSQYLQRLIAADLKGGTDSIPSPKTADPLIQLIESFCPSDQHLWQRIFKRYDIDQTQMIKLMLEEALEQLDTNMAAAEEPGQYNASLVTRLKKRRAVKESSNRVSKDRSA